MNLHREAQRKKLIVIMLVCSVLLLMACYVVGFRDGLMDTPSVPVTGYVDMPSVPQNTTSTDIQSQPAGNDGQQGTEPAVQTTPPTESAPTQPVTATPSGSPERYECGGRLTVVTDSANVRTDADKDAAFVRAIHKGESYDVIAQKPSTGRVLWYEIRLDENTTGYVAATYVSYDGKIVNGKAYLTFDDGPSENTKLILDILDRYNAKATFFVIYHKNRESTYRSIVERGHTLALHSYSHNYSDIYSSERSFYRDIERLSDYVCDVTGVRSNVIRFPGGSSNTISKKYSEGIMTSLTRSAAEHGYAYFDWDVNSGDADAVVADADTIYQNVKDGVQNRRDPIILMHDAAVKTTTVDALPRIIEYLQGRGYQLLPLTVDTPPAHDRVNN